MKTDKKLEKSVEEIEHDESDESSDIEGAKKPRFNSLKSRTFWLIITSIVATLLLLIAIPGFFDNSALKFKLEQKASETLNSNLIISGDVKVALFPYPVITAQDVLLQSYKNDGKVYGLHAKSVKIRLSIVKFFEKEFSISKLSFTDATLETYFEENVATVRSNKFNDIVSQFSKNPVVNPANDTGSKTSSELFLVGKFQASQFSASSLPTIEIENGLIISYDKSSRKREIENISGKVMIDAKKIRASGKFTNEKIDTNFKLTANFNSDASKQDSTLELNSAAMNLTIKGSFTGENSGIFNSDFSGKADAEIFEIRNFYKDYISNNSAIYDKLKPNSQSVKISADIKNNSGEIALDNILINSNLIDGKGSALIDFTTDIPRIDISLDLENLDFDSIWSNERVVTTLTDNSVNLTDGSDETIETLAPANTPVDDTATKDSTATDPTNPDKKPEELNLKIATKIKNFDLSSEVKIKNVKYLEGTIKDLNLYLTISKEGQILILPMIFNIPGDAIVRINGVLENDGDLPKFIGKIDVSGKNLGESFKWLQLQSQNLKFDNLKEYIIYSDLMLFPNNITLDNFYLNLNNEQSEFLGDVRIDSTDKVTSITNKFQVSTFNIDDFFLTSGQNIYFSAGSLLKKLLWLNDISSVNDIDLTFDKLIYKGEEFSGQSSLKLKFGQGYFKVNELKLNSDKTNLQANISVDISSQNPEFIFNLVADNLHYEATSSAKPEDAKDIKDVKKINVADQFFALPSLEGFNGNISLVIGNLKLDDLEIKDSKLGGKLKDGNINDGIANCSLYGGNFKYKGLIGIKRDKTFNGNLTLDNIALEKLLPDLIGVKNVKGVTNISANITSVASSKADFVKTLTSEIKFNAVTPIVDGYGLSELVNKMLYPTSYRQDLQNPENILNNPSGRTFFKQASGTITLDKDKGNKFNINLAAPAVNGILSGKFDLSANKIDGLTNIIFVTGNKQKQVPLNIATALKGDMNAISSSSNLDQVRQYLRLPVINKPAPIAAPASATTSAATPSTTPTAEIPAPTTVAAPNSATPTAAAPIPTAPAQVAAPTAESIEKDRSAKLLKIQEDAEKQKVFDQINAATHQPAAAPAQ